METMIFIILFIVFVFVIINLRDGEKTDMFN